MTSSPPRGARMQAARLHGPGDLRMDEVPVPTPSNAQVRLHMRSVGLCGSDRHLYREGSTGSEPSEEPLVLGHEIAAEVPEESADALGVNPGTIVAVDPAHPCGTCEWCERGHPNLCPNVEFKGAAPHPGALAEYLIAYPAEVIPMPPDVGPDEAALLEPLGVAIHAVDLAEIRPMETVAVLGAGPIGLLLAQVARLAGAGACYVIDPLAYRVEAARSLGTTAAAQRHEDIAEWTDDRGADVVLEATNAPEGFQHAVESVRIGGRVVLVGIPEGDESSVTASQVRRKGLTVKWCRRMGDVYPRALQMVRSGRVEVDPLVSHRFPLAETPEAVALQANYEDGVMKAVVTQESAFSPE